MQVVARTDEYTIFKKRNQRYAVRNKDREWVRGDDKVAVLLAHNLIVAPASSAPDQPEEPPTAEAGDSPEAAAEAGDESGSDESGSDESGSDEEKG